MYQLKQIINDELAFESRPTESEKVVEHMLKVMVSREDHIGITDKSGQLVDIEKKKVIWSPGEREVTYESKGQRVIMKISVV